MAPSLAHKQLTRLVNEALRIKLLRPASLQEVIDHNPLHPGTKLLRPFLESAHSPTYSAFEDDFLAFVESYGLPRPEVNFPLNGRKLDAFWPEYGLIVECDGWDTHRTHEAFETDRERDADHLDQGLSTVRITKQRLENRPDYEAARFTRILRRLAAQRC